MFSPDFVKLAEAYGCPGYRAIETSEVEDVIKKALAVKNGPVIVEFKVVQEDNVYPMIPAGQTWNEMLDVPNQELSEVEGEEIETEELITLTKG